MSTEQLLEEYLRVINAKDSEITRLLRDNERWQLELHRKEDKYRSKLIAIKGQLDHFHAAATSRSKQDSEEAAHVERLKQDNEALRNDVVTLRDAVKKSDTQLQEVLRSASKAQKHEAHAREKVESEFRRVRSSLEDKLFEALQRCGHLEAMASSGGAKATDAEKELTRWKVEAQRLQHDTTEQHRVIKELKRRIREMVPKELAESEALQLEDRYSIQVSTLEKECSKLRDAHREESHRAQRTEGMLVEFRKRNEDLEQEMLMSRRQFEEINVAYATAKVQYTATLEDTKKTFTSEARVVREQLEKERYARVSHEGEILTLRQRATELEGLVAQHQSKGIQDHQGAQDEIQGLKHKLQETLMELDASRRRSQGLEEVERTLRTKCDALRSDADVEISKLKSELLSADDLVMRRDGDIQHLNRLLAEARAQVQALQHELATEKTTVAKKEQETRSNLLSFDEQLRKRDDDRRALIDTCEDQVRQLERQLSEERIQRQRELQRQAASSHQQLEELQDRLTHVESRNREWQHECQVLKEEIAVRTEKERSSHDSIARCDERLMKLQLEVSEREASAQTLQRTLEQTVHSLKATQIELDEARQALSHEKAAFAQLDARLQSTNLAVGAKEDEVRTLQQQIKALERTALGNASELQTEMTSIREKLRQVSVELNASHQQNAAMKVEMNRSERSWNDEQLITRRDIIAPLEQRVEQLMSNGSRLTRELADRDERIQDMSREVTRLTETNMFLTSECASKDQKLAQASEDLESSQSQLASLRRTQQQLAAAHEDARRSRSDGEILLEKIRHLEAQLQSKAAELTQMHDREIDLVTELSNKKSELATLRERYANLESLKTISDQNVSELQARERDLLEKLDEVRSAQNMMQLCFDKQQEQIELSRRLRNNDSHGDSGIQRLQF